MTTAVLIDLAFDFGRIRVAITGNRGAGVRDH
jgi:hypothetical protein